MSTNAVHSVESMAYPAIAHAARMQGPVVLQAVVDVTGTVTDATSTVANEPILRAAAVANLLSWRFKPQSAGTYDVIYNFRISRGVCSDSAKSFFVVEPTRPIRVEVVTCAYVIGAVFDPEPPYREMTYPADALEQQLQGTVIVRAHVDGKGSVTSAIRVSGEPLLAAGATDNVKHWQFPPGRSRREFVVYHFVIVPGLCGDTHRSFYEAGERHVTVMACRGTPS